MVLKRLGARKIFRTNVRQLKNVDLKTTGDCVAATWKDLSRSDREKLRENGVIDWIPDREETVYIWAPVIPVLRLDSVCDLDTCDPTDYEQVEEAMKCLIREAKHYMVSAPGKNWDGEGGSWITDKASEAIQRDYDCRIYPAGVSGGGKVLACSEHSHDAPMGSSVLIIALTDKEYERMKDADAAQRQAFADRMERRVVYA